MDFLLDLGLSKEDIEEIVARNDQGILYNVSLNKKNVIEIVKYFKEIGVSALRKNPRTALQPVTVPSVILSVQ